MPTAPSTLSFFSLRASTPYPIKAYVTRKESLVGPTLTASGAGEFEVAPFYHNSLSHSAEDE
jgi:hypothetical protein